MLTAKTSTNLSLTLPYQLATPNHTQKSYLHDGQNQQFIEPNFVYRVLTWRFQFFQAFKIKMRHYSERHTSLPGILT